MAEEKPKRHSGGFDPLARLGGLTRLSHSTPSSPRLLPRRARDVSGGAMGTVPRPDSGDALGAGPSCGSSEKVNWQARCLELQLELHTSRTQATRTRDMLRDKAFDSRDLVSMGNFDLVILRCNSPSRRCEHASMPRVVEVSSCSREVERSGSVRWSTRYKYKEAAYIQRNTGIFSQPSVELHNMWKPLFEKVDRLRVTELDLSTSLGWPSANAHNN